MAAKNNKSPRNKQGKKRARQAEKARAQNASQRSAMRTAVKKLLKIIDSADKNASVQGLSSASSALDKAARKGLIHKNKASRLKSRLNAKVVALA